MDRYGYSPNDPRYLGMTDDEILFDFFTVEEMEVVRREKLAEAADEGEVLESVEDARIEDIPIAPGQSRNLTVKADLAEFRRWWRENMDGQPLPDDLR